MNFSMSTSRSVTRSNFAFSRTEKDSSLSAEYASTTRFFANSSSFSYFIFRLTPNHS